MFRCSVCKESIGPNVKPIHVTAQVRHVDYTNIKVVLDEYDREHKELIESRGTEIISEDKLCPPCAGVKDEAPATTPEVLKRMFARNKPFEEKLPEPFRPFLVELAGYNAIERAEHGTPAADAETVNNFATIKGFIERNPKFKF